jgi:D-proline reductase (dithiol) PrdB
MVMTHVFVNFDHTGFQRDINVAYPLDRLRALADEGAIGSVADTHYSVMGANDPGAGDELADGMAERLRQDRRRRKPARAFGPGDGGPAMTNICHS